MEKQTEFRDLKIGDRFTFDGNSYKKINQGEALKNTLFGKSVDSFLQDEKVIKKNRNRRTRKGSRE